MATDVSLLSLFAADKDQIEESRRRTFQQWGKASNLSSEQYRMREEFLAAQEMAKDGKLIVWVLAPRDNPTTINFLCSCETYRRDGYVWYRSAVGQGNASTFSKTVACYGIASVFTPKEYRGKGYATHMMRLLHWVIAEESLLPKQFPVDWGAPPPKVKYAGNGLFSALWSDVGDFYRQCGLTPEGEGWIVVSPKSTTWNVDHALVAQGGLDPQCRWLDRAGVSTLWEKDATRMKGAAKLPSKARVSFTFLPQNGVAAFQHQRIEVLLNKLEVREFGVVVGDNQSSTVVLSDRTAFASWVIEEPPEEPIGSTGQANTPGERTLLITRLESRVEDFNILFEAIVSVARKYGTKKIEAYNLAPELHPLATSTGGEHQTRKAHLSAIKWYGPEQVTGGEEKSEVVWLHNERYCWC